MSLLLGLFVLTNTTFNLMMLIDSRRLENLAREAIMKADFCMRFLRKNI